MKCPVCRNETNPNDKECTICGFTELNVEFLSVEEAESWHRAVVMPARALWNAAQKMHEKALSEYQKLEKKTVALKKKYDGLLVDYENLRKDFDTLAPLSPKVPASLTNPKPGWNTSGPIAHPNFVSCAYQRKKFELSNISSAKSGSRVIVSFVAKKTYDPAGDSSSGHISFNYKIKDPTGIVVATNSWIKGGLMVGDAMRSEITINGIETNGYSIEFSDG